MKGTERPKSDIRGRIVSREESQSGVGSHNTDEDEKEKVTKYGSAQAASITMPKESATDLEKPGRYRTKN